MKKHWKLLLITAALTGLLCLPAAAEEAHSGLYDITAAQTDVTVTALGGKAEAIEIDGETKTVYAGSTGLHLRYTAAEAGSEYVVFAVRDGDADPTEDNVVYLAQSSSGEFEIRPEQLEEEFKGCLELARYILDVLGLEEDITYRFSQWDPNNTEKYEGTPEQWNEAQELMGKILDHLCLLYTSPSPRD